jgi:hypothetical protein
MTLLMTFSHPYLSICADPLDVVSLQVYLSFKRDKKHLVFATPHGIIEVTSHWLAGCGRTGRALYMLPSDRPTMTMPLPSIMGALQCAWAVGLWPGWQTTSACMRSLQTNNFAGACETMYIVCTWYIHILMCHIRTNKAHTRSGHAHTHMHMQACECLHIYIKNRL